MVAWILIAWFILGALSISLIFLIEGFRREIQNEFPTTIIAMLTLTIVSGPVSLFVIMGMFLDEQWRRRTILRRARTLGADVLTPLPGAKELEERRQLKIKKTQTRPTRYSIIKSDQTQG